MKGLGIGRIVHYHHTSVRDGMCAAIVTRIVDKERGVVQLQLFQEGSAAVHKYSVGFSDLTEGDTAAGFWTWPPRDEPEPAKAKLERKESTL